MQNKVKQFNQNLKKLSQMARGLDISSETGEVLKEILKCTNYGKNNFLLSEQLKIEIGDLLYSIFSFCNENNINSDECLNMALNKYKNRLSQKGTLGSD